MSVWHACRSKHCRKDEEDEEDAKGEDDEEQKEFNVSTVLDSKRVAEVENMLSKGRVSKVRGLEKTLYDVLFSETRSLNETEVRSTPVMLALALLCYYLVHAPFPLSLNLLRSINNTHVQFMEEVRDQHLCEIDNFMLQVG
jgi:hypothetical protein